LVGEPWVLQPADTIAGQGHIDCFRSAGLDVPQKKVISASVHVQIGMVATERYFTIFPRSMLHFSARRLSLKALPIRLNNAPFNVGIVTLKKRSVAPAALAFIRLAREMTKPLARARFNPA
jgi:DNA-binding transcriptional LysR family regulator